MPAKSMPTVHMPCVAAMGVTAPSVPARFRLHLSNRLKQKRPKAD